MNNQQIDYIYYVGTSTDLTTGYITEVQAQYFVPFLDYFLVFTVLSFTILVVWFAKVILYSKTREVRIFPIRENTRVRKEKKVEIINF